MKSEVKEIDEDSFIQCFCKISINYESNLYNLKIYRKNVTFPVNFRSR